MVDTRASHGKLVQNGSSSDLRSESLEGKSGLYGTVKAADAWNSLREMFIDFPRFPRRDLHEKNVEFCEKLIEACRTEKPSGNISDMINYLCHNSGSLEFQLIPDAFALNMWNCIFRRNRDASLIGTRDIMVVEKTLAGLETIRDVLSEFIMKNENGPAFLKQVARQISEAREFLERTS